MAEPAPAAPAPMQPFVTSTDEPTDEPAVAPDQTPEYYLRLAAALRKRNLPGDTEKAKAALDHAKTLGETRNLSRRPPEGFVQRQSPNGALLPSFELKSEADARPKGTEKRAENQMSVSDRSAVSRRLLRPVVRLPSYPDLKMLRGLDV